MCGFIESSDLDDPLRSVPHTYGIAICYHGLSQLYIMEVEQNESGKLPSNTTYRLLGGLGLTVED